MDHNLLLKFKELYPIVTKPKYKWEWIEKAEVSAVFINAKDTDTHRYIAFHTEFFDGYLKSGKNILS